MIEVLVSDLGQVVLPFDFSPSKEFMLRRCSPPESHADLCDSWQALWDLHERHNFGAGGCEGQQFYQYVVRDLGMDATYEEFCEAWSDVFQADDRVIDLIRRARVKHRFLLSNTNAIHWEWILTKHAESLQVFDKLLASQELGVMKPSPEVFRKVEALTGLGPEAHILIDDLEENIDGARACGWDGIVHTNASALDVELRRRGLI